MADSKEQIRQEQLARIARLNQNANRRSAFQVADEQAARARARDDDTVNNSSTRARGTAPVISNKGQPIDDVVAEAETGRRVKR